MKRLMGYIVDFLLLLCLFLTIPACSGSTTGSAVEKTVILIVVLIIVVLCALVALGIAIWQFYRHNRDKISAPVADIKQAISALTPPKK